MQGEQLGGYCIHPVSDDSGLDHGGSSEEGEK